MNQSDIEIRPLAARDSFEALTQLLRRAYAPLAAAGMNFSAAAQSADDTARRAAEGQCFVATSGGQPVGTVTVRGPLDNASVHWFRDVDTAHFHQFAVDPRVQRQGLGSRLIAMCEQWAIDRGYRAMVLATAQPALELRGLFRHLGYRDIGDMQRDGKTYRSVIMRKLLDRSPMRAHLLTLARYNEWATRRLLDEHVRGLNETDYRRDMGLFFKSVHGTLNHLLVGEHLLWFRRFAEGVSPSVALNDEAEPDRARLAQRLIEGAARWAPLIESWPESRFDGQIDYTTTRGQAVSLPFAATLAHVFNHGTHHRGQICAALTAMGWRSPELDLVYMLQQEQAR
jgi:uncharacterized damage-inducible protein DinB/GNAT superfamily N-acetyltransferase